MGNSFKRNATVGTVFWMLVGAQVGAAIIGPLIYNRDKTQTVVVVCSGQPVVCASQPVKVKR